MITLTAKITLADGTEIAIDKRNGLYIDESIMDRSDIVLPSWGIISNGGSISFMDYDGNIKELAQNLKLTSNTKVNIYLNNTLTKQSALVGEFFTENWDYDNNNFEVRVSITDGLQKMQDITITPLEYDLSREYYTLNAVDLYTYLCEQANENNFNIIYPSAKEFDSETLAHLSNIIVPIPYINSTNLWRALNDFAVAFQLHIYKNRKGAIVCVYNGSD